jgi:hypothetical protein
MDNTFAWRFEDSSLWFVSTPETINKHITKARRDLEIHPDTKIIYSNDRPTPSVVFDNSMCLNNISVGTVEPNQIGRTAKANKLPNVSNVVDKSIPTVTPLPTPTPDGNSRSGNFGPGL